MSIVVTLLAIWAAGALLRRLSAAADERGSPGAPIDVGEGFGLGAAVSFQVFLWGVWFRPFHVSWLAIAPLLAGAALLGTRARRRPTPCGRPAAEPWTRGEIAAMVAVALVLAAGIGLMLALPIFDWDTRNLWAHKAKILATERTVVADIFRDPYRLHVHPRYPLLVPWLAALPASLAGGFQERHYQVVVGTTAVLGALQLYRLGRESGPRQGALLGVLLMVLTAAWLRSLLFTGVEMALVLYLLLSVQALWRWLERRRAVDLTLGAVYLFGCASVKNEGQLLSLCLAAAFGLVVLCRREGGRRNVAAAVALPGLWGLLMAVWWWHLRFIPPVSDENYPARLRPEFLLGGLSRLPELLLALGTEALDFMSWHLVWAGFPLLCLWAWRRGLRDDPRSLLLTLVCALYWGGVFVIYLVSPWKDLGGLVEVTFHRIFLPLLPLVVLLLQRTLARARAV